MLDPRLLRSSPQAVADNLARRGMDFDVERFTALEAQRKEAQVDLEALRAERNSMSRKIGAIKAAGENASEMLEWVATFGEKIEAREEELAVVLAELDTWMLELPNLLDERVPDGTGESDNVVLREHGRIPEFPFEARDHVELGERWGLLDAASAAAMSGARFTVLHGDLALLHRALGQFMLQMQVAEHGYRECHVPCLVRADSLRGTGQLPKFEEDLFAVAGGESYLIPTAEVPLTNLVRDRLVEAEELPLKWAALTPCFRAEAGSYGSDTRGLIRQHQFDKVELVQVVRPDDSDRALEEITGHAEAVLQALGLGYRVVALCAADTGFSAARTWDIEVWLPGQGRYREISSCSDFRDFQARRLSARWRNGDATEPVHTLNGSALAVGRCLVAVLENFQRADGTVEVPECLAPWMGGRMMLGED